MRILPPPLSVTAAPYLHVAAHWGGFRHQRPKLRFGFFAYALSLWERQEARLPL